MTNLSIKEIIRSLEIDRDNLRREAILKSEEADSIDNAIKVLLKRMPKEPVQIRVPVAPVVREVPVKMSFKEKTISFVAGENRFLHTTEIVKAFAENGEIRGLTDETALQRIISPILSRAREKDKILVTYKDGNSLKNVYWGLPKWLNEDGSIKDGHEYLKERGV